MSANWNSLRMLAPGIVPPEKWNALVDAVRAATVSSFVGGKFTVTGLGTLLQTAPSLGSVIAHPLQILDASADNQLKVSVRFGMIGGVLPTINGTGLSNSDPPTLSVAATSFIYVKIDASGGSHTAIIDAAASVPTDDFETAKWVHHFALGRVVVENGKFQTPFDQAVTHSLNYAKLCDGSISVWAV
jgi:hypothetical protein